MKEPPSIFQECIKLIDLLAEEMKNGDKIVRTSKPKELRWCWKNTRTGRELFVRLNDLKKIDQRDNICFETVIDFILGNKTALEAQVLLKKLPKLKAFL